MKLTIEPTDQLVHLDGVPVRVWKGTLESGRPVDVFVHRIGTADPAAQRELEKVLREQLPPGRHVDLRQVF